MVICLVAGLVLQQISTLVITIIVGILLTVFIFHRFKSGKLHYLYFLFPIIIIVAYGLMEYTVNMYNTGPEGTCRLNGMVYKVTENDYGYRLYVKNSFFDHKRIVVTSDVRYSPGTEIEIEGEYREFNEVRNPGEFDSAKYYYSQKIHASVKAENIKVISRDTHPIYSIMDKISQKISRVYKNMLDTKYASVYEAMILGKKDDLDSELSDLFSAGGIGHILAISGLHISIIGMGLYKLIRRTGAGFVISMIISTAFIIMYGIMTGNGVSTVRALIMFIIAVYANVVGKTYDMMSAASLAAIISLVDSPYLIYNCGFLLSYLAICGIAYVYDGVRKTIKSDKKILNSFIVSLCIQFTTLPVTLYYYFQVPVLSVFLNIIVIPLMTVVMIAGIGGGIVGCFFLPLGELVAAPGVVLLKGFEKLCDISINIPWNIITPGRPSAVNLLIYYILLILMVYGMSKYGRKIYALIILPAIVAVMMKVYPDFYVVFLDVGQGDGIFIRNSTGTTFLIDCGSSDNKSLYDYTLEPFLLSEGICNIDYVIVSHCDTDHISGIKDMLDSGNISVGTVFLPSVDNPDEKYFAIELAAIESGAEVRNISRGMFITDADMEMLCLHPDKDYAASDKNSYSTSLYVEYKGFSMLLTGDISEKEEKRILAYGDLQKNITVYKAAHHGSQYSNGEDFLDYIKPEYTIISYGEDNSYGHPHKETMDRLNSAGTNIYHTARSGAVSVRIDNNRMTIDSVK